MKLIEKTVLGAAFTGLTAAIIIGIFEVIFELIDRGLDPYIIMLIIALALGATFGLLAAVTSTWESGP